MTDAVAHRGPDSGAVERFESLAFGHRRLKVIDLNESANQPMIDPKSGHVIVFNGEIYNYREVRKSLTELGVQFVTQSDTEVLLKSFLQWGAECLKHLAGMFVFAIWCPSDQRLFIARDRLGKKPLYYFCDSEGFWFASELTALMKSGRTRLEIDEAALSHYLAFNYTSSEKCIVQGVKKLPAGHFLTITKGSEPEVFRYWDLAKSFSGEKRTITEMDALEEFSELFDKAVRERLYSDVPLGAFLSGGVDSAMVTESMARLTSNEMINAYTLSFDEASFDESDGASETAAEIGVSLTCDQMSRPLAEFLPRVVAAYDEPFADSSMLPTYAICESTRKYVTVALSGDGGDESFAGYPTYVASKIHSLTGPAFGWLSPSAAMLFERFGPVRMGKVGFDEKIRRFLASNHMCFPHAHAAWRLIFSDAQRQQLMGQSFSSGHAEDPFSAIEAFDSEVQNASLLDRAIYVDLKTWLVDDILVKVDRASMAHALEVRAPFLDHRLVEFAAKLPTHMKMRGMRGKQLLRQAAKKRLSRKILERPKQGFGAPVARWLQGSLTEIGRDVTLRGPITSYIDTAPVEKLWSDHLSGVRDNGLRLFGLVCFGLWLRNAVTVNVERLN